MFSSGKSNIVDGIINISDDVIVIDSSCKSVVNISESVIISGHSIITISDTSNSDSVINMYQ